MELLKNIPTQQKQIVISEKLVEVGDDTWQIKNLTGVSTRESKVVLDVPEPTFSESKPAGEFQFAPLIILTVIGAIIASNTNNPLWFWGGGIIGLFSIWNDKADEKQKWQRKYDNYCHQYWVWKELKDNPPIVYSLAFETNAGSRPAFYTFSKDSIVKAVNAIKQSMINPTESLTTYNINAIDLSGDTNINNVGSTIYEQNIKEYR